MSDRFHDIRLSHLDRLRAEVDHAQELAERGLPVRWFPLQGPAFAKFDVDAKVWIRLNDRERFATLHEALYLER